MKKIDIKVGHYYKSKINGVMVTVRVDCIRIVGPYVTAYDVTDIANYHTMTFKSTQKFRWEIEV